MSTETVYRYVINFFNYFIKVSVVRVLEGYSSKKKGHRSAMTLSYYNKNFFYNSPLKAL